ncbi:hypothetical protein GCM10023185_22240 [Hymenobacter saemangeumensis]|uniref:Peptidase M43 pregnancy-associated plasma-A domain-containing protein n=2 Tax=Hymenobacter saemangeumensis TaxID=1084522 RepID=A0ABP8IF00_9BACT
MCCVLGLSFAKPALAQRNRHDRGCGTTENNEAMQQQLEHSIPGYNRNAPAAPLAGALRTTNQDYTIPIVFHVVHNGEAVGTGSNISDTRILEQLTRLNEDFAKLNADRTSVPAAFQPVHADMQIQFALAQRDPNGNCFNGINRINRSSKGWTAPPYTQTYCNSTIKPGSFWDPSKYMNFWVVDLGGGLLGFAQFPDNTAGLGGLNTSGGSASTDGVVCLYSSVGNGGLAAAPYNLGRTATHEIGHWLGLRHIWGDASCGTDYVTDTPTQSTSNYGCPSFPKVTCSNGPNGDQFMNYMDYTDDACMFMFSAGQKARMQAVMAAGTPRRTSLATSTALPPAVTVEASTVTPLVCAGGTILLNGTAPSGYTYSWTGPNNFTSTQQNPSVSNATLASGGTYTMTVMPAGGCPVSTTVDVEVREISGTPTLVSSANTTCSGTSVTLTATPSGAQTATAINQNWNTGTTEGGWTRDNTGTANGPNSAPAWAIYSTTPGIDGTRYVMVDASTTNNNILTRSALYSPVFSLSTLATATLTFQHILRFQSGDLCRVEISTNGGSSWTVMQSYTANQGSSTTTTASPANASFNLDSYAGQSNLQLRWFYSSNSGFNWALDNIKVEGNIANTYAWSVLSGDGLPTNAGSGNTLVVTPTQTSVYQVTVTAPGKCSSGGTIVSVSVPTSTTWTGSAGGGNWNNVGNWNACVPTRTMTATIPAGLATAYPIVSATAEVRHLVQHGPVTMSGGSLAVYGDHTGAGSFTQTGGTFVVAGAGAQSLRGLSYGAMSFSGAGVKTLAANATASGAVTMTGGVLTTGSNTLTLTGSAALSETSASYILGRVFTSVGLTAGSSSSFRGIGASITVPAGSVSPGVTTALRITGSRLMNPAVAGYQSISRYYDLTPTVNTGLNLTVALNYNATADLGDLVESRLVAFRAVAVNGPFQRMNGTLNMSAGTFTIPNVDHLSVWTLADANSPLPVSLTSFEVAAAGTAARLVWATASEKNNDHFVVEASTNGHSFHTLGRVAGIGTTAQRQQYSYTDAQVSRYGASVVYYRLKQVDTDGTFSYSPVRTLAVGKGQENGLTALLWPNPSTASDAAPSLALHGFSTEPLTLTLRDALGRVHSVRTLTAPANNLSLTEAAGLPAGLYVLEVLQGSQRLSLKVLRD